MFEIGGRYKIDSRTRGGVNFKCQVFRKCFGLPLPKNTPTVYNWRKTRAERSHWIRGNIAWTLARSGARLIATAPFITFIYVFTFKNELLILVARYIRSKRAWNRCSFINVIGRTQAGYFEANHLIWKYERCAPKHLEIWWKYKLALRASREGNEEILEELNEMKGGFK